MKLHMDPLSYVILASILAMLYGFCTQEDEAPPDTTIEQIKSPAI